jgi:2,4-dienoyl-CoA reductase-like NADH-dependent reductase (Old Yellow Enzyme family)
LTMTCASHVQAIGKGFPGQLGCFSDIHLDGLSRLGGGIRKEGSLAVLQLHHAGMRSPVDEIGEQPVCPSTDEKTGARALELAEVEQLKEDFISAAMRAEKAGFDGVQIHGAHGYILCQFLSPEINQRKDEYGGSLENRAKLLSDIIDGIRNRCRADFLLSVRLSPERFGMRLEEVVELSQKLCREGKVDLLDISLWDSFKEPEEEAFKGRSLMSYFTGLDRGEVRLGVAGKLQSGQDIQHCLDAGVDCVIVGRAAILHHDLPRQLLANPDFKPKTLPVTADYLRSQGLGETFIQYMAGWEGFVASS